MSYSYSMERDHVFTESGQRLFLSMRDNAQRLLKEAGAVRMQELMRGQSGDVWHMLACVDRMVELKELREITAPDSCAGQFRVFVLVKDY